MPDNQTADSTAVPEILPAEPIAAIPAAVEPERVSEPSPGKFDAVVDLWFAECIQGTEIGRYTGAYNAAHAAIGELKRRLNQET